MTWTPPGPKLSKLGFWKLQDTPGSSTDSGDQEEGEQREPRSAPATSQAAKL